MRSTHEVGTLVVMGGDGMMHLGINVVAGRPAVSNLGMIPAGTGNDLCRGLGLTVSGPGGGGAGHRVRTAASRSTCSRSATAMSVGSWPPGSTLSSTPGPTP